MAERIIAISLTLPDLYTESVDALKNKIHPVHHGDNKVMKWTTPCPEFGRTNLA